MSWIKIPWPIPMIKDSHWSSIFSLIFSFIFFLIVITAFTSIPLELLLSDPLLSLLLLLTNCFESSTVLLFLLFPLLITALTDPCLPFTRGICCCVNLLVLNLPATEVCTGRRTVGREMSLGIGLAVNIFAEPDQLWSKCSSAIVQVYVCKYYIDLTQI